MDRAFDLDGGIPAYFFIRADILLKLKRYDEAIEAAGAVFDEYSNGAFSDEQVAEGLVALDRFRDPEDRIGDLVQLASDKLPTPLLWLMVFLSQYRSDDARQIVDLGSEDDAKSQRANYLRGSVYFELGDYREAAEELRGFITDHPDSVPANLRLADSLLQLGEWMAAIDAAERVIEIAPSYSRPHYVRGRCLMEIGRHEDAVAALDELLTTQDDRSLLLATHLVRVSATTRRPTGISNGSPNCSPTIRTSGSNERASRSTRESSTRRLRPPPA